LSVFVTFHPDYQANNGILSQSSLTTRQPTLTTLSMLLAHPTVSSSTPEKKLF
jgi:hypothetical protein